MQMLWDGEEKAYTDYNDSVIHTALSTCFEPSGKILSNVQTSAHSGEVTNLIHEKNDNVLKIHLIFIQNQVSDQYVFCRDGVNDPNPLTLNWVK